MTIASEDPVIPSLPELLNALSTAPRSNREKERDIGLRNTLKALLSRACLDNVPIREYACLAILLAFKRRNHQKSMAAGDGDGERSFLRAVLLELYSLAEDHSEGADLRRMVELVLPLVPHYGSWRDLLLLGELSFPEYTSDMDVKEPLHPPALAQTVGKIFANQLSHDMELLVLSQQQESNVKNFVPSNACKYAPHENRHSGNKTFKEEKVKSPRKSKLIYLNRIQRCLGDYVATMLQGRDNNLPLRHFYRKFLSKLKAILTESGFVIEPLLCNKPSPVDLLCLTRCDASREDVSADSYHEMITKLRLSHSTQLGCISFYRMSDCQAGADSSINPFVLRFKPSSLNPSDVSLDLCLVMDLTASMGCWMEAAKAHLADIVDSLKKETNIGCIRISYIGYRDWQDNGRLVVHDFVPIESVGDSLLPLMKKQQPSGGGDMEEDVLIAFYAAQTQLSWNGNIRVMIHVADAPAHGFGGSGDRFKSGRCPDQQPPHPSLEESLRNLAAEKKMDLLFCQVCSSFSSKMVRMFKGVYNDGPGFGVLTIEQGASKFKDAVLSTLSTSMLEALAPEDIPGLQCFSGGTASSLLRVLNSNLRGAVDSFFREEESTAGLEGVDCCLGDEESDEDNGNSDLPGSHAGRSNHDRLMSELEADDLQPVRLALGMSTQAKLQSEAAALLLSNGVSVEIMLALSYPDEIIQLMRQEGMKRLKTL